MKLRTETEIKKSKIEINHRSKLLMIGSCFAQNIGQKLEENKFDILLNPFGILYNPVSIAKAMERLIGKKEFSGDDLFFHKGLYHSFCHHGCFSHDSQSECLNNINILQQKATLCLHDANMLFVTFGTAYVYEYAVTKEVVGNCHKLPASDFRRYRLTTEAIVNEWLGLIDKLRAINPKLCLIFTVSPIRHLRDGAHDNQLSKATLLLAIDELRSKRDNVHYFPSYEIVLDDLRDYRFYDRDMVHPNALAIEYIWNVFGEIYFSDETKNIIKEWQKLKKAIAHKPINRGTDEHTQFLKQTLLKLDEFNAKYPFICINSETDDLNDQLKK